MRNRRRSPLGFILAAAALGVAFWWFGIWPFRRTGDAPPPARIPAAADTVRAAYEALSEDFRAKVPLGEFAAMFERMKQPEGDELPKVVEAQATDGAGPEPPLARLWVEHPGETDKASYDFARMEGSWKLQSYARNSRAASAFARAAVPFAGEAKGTTRPPVSPPTPNPSRQPTEGLAQPSTSGAPRLSATGASAGNAQFPRYHVVQPGDTLATISRQYYGTGRYWRRIIEANPGLQERRLNIGRRILIPAPPEHIQGDPSQNPEPAPEAPKR